MAGAGSRFVNQGFDLPKYLINVKGRTLFEWSMLSLIDFFDQEFFFAVRDKKYIPDLESLAGSMGISKMKFIVRNNLSRGQAETAYDVIKTLTKDELVWIYNIDTYVKSGLDPESIKANDGCIFVFKSNANNMSYVKYDEDGLVNDLAEKIVISEWATVGLYGFRTAELYISAYQKTYLEPNSKIDDSEQYIVPMYKCLLNEEYKITAPKLKNSDVYILGTPEDVLTFKKQEF
jgi:choline kinase